MKRLLPLVAELERDELLGLSKLVQERLSEDGWLVTKQFLSSGNDVFRGEILERLAREIYFQELRGLRLVCKQWSVLVMETKYIYFGLNNWSSSIYSVFLGKYFTQVKSIKSHAKILSESFSDDWGGFGHIKSLEIVKLGEYERIRGEVDLRKWTSLETLLLQKEDFEYPIKGLSTLTRLTNLKCDAYVMKSLDELLPLTNLTQLSITRFHNDSQIAIELPHLKYLESDSPGHFVGFSGTGVLDSGDFDIDEFEEEEKEMAQTVFDYYLKGAWRLDLSGEWKNGVFSGRARSIQYYDSGQQDMIMKGTMVNGKFHGSSIKEIDYERKYLYQGEYQSGVKHGLGVRYTWGEVFFWCDKDLVPVTLEYWLNGTKKDEFLFL